MWKAILGLLTFRLSFAATPKKIAAFLEGKGETDRRNAEFAAPEAVRGAAVQLAPRAYRDWKDYAAEIYRLAKSAVDAGAQVVVFPEYVGARPPHDRPRLEADAPLDVRRDPARPRRPLPAAHGRTAGAGCRGASRLPLRALHVYLQHGRPPPARLPRGGQRPLLGGGAADQPVRRLRPRRQPAGAQEKICAIGPDRALGVEPSGLIEPVETAVGPIGVVLGTDAYYFECFKILREQGARLIAVPGVGGGILPDLLRCRANENGVYALYACYASGGAARCGIFAPLDATPGKNGVVALADGPQACALAARTNLEKLHLAVIEGEPNASFLAEDYLHSYRYCGKLPLLG